MRGESPSLDFCARLTQFHDHSILPAKIGNVCLRGFLHPERVHRFDDFAARRFKRLFRLYAFVVEAELIFCRLWNRVADMALEQLVPAHALFLRLQAHDLVVQELFQCVPLGKVVFVLRLEKFATFLGLQLGSSYLTAVNLGYDAGVGLANGWNRKCA